MRNDSTRQKDKKFNFTVGTLRYPGRGGKENGESLERGRRHLRGKNLAYLYS